MALRSLRGTLAIMNIVLFAVNYSLWLFVAGTQKFLDDFLMRAWRDGTMGAFIVILALMCLTAKSRLEKEVHSVGIFYIGLLFAWRTANHLGYFLYNTQLQLLIINGITIAFAICIYAHGNTYKLLTDD